jgi:hypothetical protein
MPHTDRGCKAQRRGHPPCFQNRFKVSEPHGEAVALMPTSRQVGQSLIEALSGPRTLGRLS